LDSSLIDGSPCGYGGTCLNETCESGSLLHTAKAWYVQNLQFSIPITVAAVLFTITVIWGTISCCCNYRKSKAGVLSDYGPPLQKIPSEVSSEPGSVSYPFKGTSGSGGRLNGGRY